MGQIKSNPVQLGKFYQTTEEAFGVELPVVVYYQDYPAKKGRLEWAGGPQLEPDEPAKVEINVVYVFDEIDMVAINPSDDWIEDMQVEILESLDG